MGPILVDTGDESLFPLRRDNARGGTPISNGYGCIGSHFQRLGHSVRTQSQKNEGSLGEKPNFGSKLGPGALAWGHWVKMLLLIFQ